MRDQMQVISIRPHLEMLCRAVHMLPPVSSGLHENSVCSHSNLTSYNHMFPLLVREKSDGRDVRQSGCVSGDPPTVVRPDQTRPETRHDMH